MINGIVGRPRTGKSYEAVRYHIIPTVLNDKRKVVTNIPVNLEYVKKCHGQEVADLIEVVDGNFGGYGSMRPFSHEEHFLKYDKWKNEQGQGVLFVIDEIHLSCPKGSARKELLEYYSLHGHYGHDHLILTQNARKIHLDLKDMTEIVWRTTKLSAFGKDDTYIQNTHHGFDNLRTPVNTEQRKYDKEWFPYYKSHTLSKSSVVEATAQQVKANIYPYKKTIICLIGLPLIFLFSQFGSYLFADPVETKSPGHDSKKTVIKQNVTAVKLPKTSQNLQNTTVTAPKTFSKTPLTKNEIERNKREKQSLEYHPFHQVQLHIGGSYNDSSTNETKLYLLASTNGQKVFDLEIKDLFLAGYSVRVLGDCLAEIEYFNHRQFITCNLPSVSSAGPIQDIASN